jgi:hypothetical protein
MADSIRPGVADELLTEGVAERLTDELVHVLGQLDPAEADRRIGAFVAETVTRVVRAFPVDERSERGADLANRIITLLSEGKLPVTVVDRLRLPPQVHRASYKSGLGIVEPIRPQTPLRDTVLFTNASAEPNLASEIGKEMASANRVDALIAFVKWSGLRLLVDEIRSHLKQGRRLRVITTTYTGRLNEKPSTGLPGRGLR